MEKDNHIQEKEQGKRINRKEAIQKAGKYAAFTAASMMLLMSPVNGMAQIVSQRAIKKPKKH